jgi:hypothetical protein
MLKVNWVADGVENRIAVEAVLGLGPTIETEEIPSRPDPVTVTCVPAAPVLGE